MQHMTKHTCIFAFYTKCHQILNQNHWMHSAHFMFQAFVKENYKNTQCPHVSKSITCCTTFRSENCKQTLPVMLAPSSKQNCFSSCYICRLSSMNSMFQVKSRAFIKTFYKNCFCCSTILRFACMFCCMTHLWYRWLNKFLIQRRFLQ